MNWTETSVATNRAGSDIVSHALMRFGAKGTQIIDRADATAPDRPGARWDIMDQDVIDLMPEDVIVKAWFDGEKNLATLAESLAALPGLSGMDLGPLTLTVGTVHEQDWAEYWKRFYKPFRLGQRLVVRPTWEDYQPQEHDLVIHLDPGMAFGTGTHESTALCAGLLETYLKPGGKVLDVGTGSGILAIAAGLLGAKEVLAIDIDPVAVRTANENVQKNSMSAVVTAREGDLLKGARGRYHLVVANILADVIIALSEPVRHVLKPGGVFVCSGIIRERGADVALALERAGYTLLKRVEKGEWVAFAAGAPMEG